MLPFNFLGYINGRTLLYIGSILSRNLNTWRAWLVSLSNHLHHIVMPAHPTRSVFGFLLLSERSSHIMPASACAMAGIYGCGLLYTQELRFAPQPAWHPIAPTGLSYPTPTSSQSNSTCALYRHGGQRSAISHTASGLDSRRRFASSRGLIPWKRKKRSIYDRFMEDLFPKNNIHFTSSYLPDNKRLQSTTNAYSTA